MAVIPSQDTRPPVSFPQAARHDLEAAGISSCHLDKELHILRDWLFSEAKEKRPDRVGWLGWRAPAWRYNRPLDKEGGKLGPPENAAPQTWGPPGPTLPPLIRQTHIYRPEHLPGTKMQSNVTQH